MNKKDRIIIGIILSIQFLIIIYIGSGLFSDKQIISIPYKDMIGTTIPDDRQGWYIDTTFPQTEDGLFEYTTDIALKRGSYDITILYETDTVKNTCTFSADTITFFGVEPNKINLPVQTQKSTYSVNISEDVDDFRVNFFFGNEGYLIVKGIDIKETFASVSVALTKTIFLFCIIDLLIVAYLKKWLQKITEKKFFAFLILSGIVFLVSNPVFSGYIINGSYDMEFHMLRIEGIAEGLRSGQFPVKMQPNWMYGYGYPVSVYYGDLFLYIPAIMRLLGFSVQFSYSTLILLCNVATVFICYWCINKMTGDTIASIYGTCIYTLLPYRLTNVYVRSAIGEMLAMTFLPLLIYGFYQVFTLDTEDKTYKRTWIPLVIGFTGIIESHLLTCIMCGFFIILTCIINIKKVFRKKTFGVLCKTVIYTSLINLYFLLPFLTSMQNIIIMQDRHDKVLLQNSGVHIAQLFELFYLGWGGANDPDQGIRGEMPFGVGAGAGIAIIIFLYALFCYQKQKSDSKNKEVRLHGILLFGLALIALIITTIYFPWNIIGTALGRYRKIVTSLQFSIRFFVIVAALLSIAAGFAIHYLRELHKEKESTILVIVSCILTIISASSIMDNELNGMGASYIYDIEQLNRSDYNVTEYLLVGTDKEILVPDDIKVSNSNITIDNYNKNYCNIIMFANNESEETGYVEVPLLYYDWYTAYDNQKGKMDLVCGTNNVIRINLPAYYNGEVHVYFQKPLLWKISEIISLTSLLIIISIENFRRRKNGKV